MESDDDELTTADEVRELQAALDKALDENERLRAEIKELRSLRPATQ